MLLAAHALTPLLAAAWGLGDWHASHAAPPSFSRVQIGHVHGDGGGGVRPSGAGPANSGGRSVPQAMQRKPSLFALPHTQVQGMGATHTSATGPSTMT